MTGSTDLTKVHLGLALYRVRCKAIDAPVYSATFGDWHKRHGFVCCACGLFQPMSCPDHELTRIGGKPSRG